MTIVKLPGSILFSGDIKRMHTCIYHLLKNLCHVKTGYIGSQRTPLYQYLPWNH